MPTPYEPGGEGIMPRAELGGAPTAGGVNCAE